MKKGSADGRLLIWKVTAQMIEDKPFFGDGYNQFRANYMDYQAQYFRANLDNPEAMVAGDNNYAFNEFLKIAFECGVLGLIIALFLVYFILFSKPRVNLTDLEEALLSAARAGLVAIVVFGCFSYPGEILPIKLNFIFFAAIISSMSKPIKGISNAEKNTLSTWAVKGVAIVMIGLIPLLVSFTHKYYKAHQTWKAAYTLYQMGAYEACLEDYKEAYPLLKYNGEFLVNYGKALSMAGEHHKAVEVLEYTKDYLPNTIVYTALGDSYKALGKAEEAEQAYLQAWHMNPSRFYPKYLLAKLYNETGQKEKAVEVARELLNKEVKVESTAIKEIKAEMEEIISKNIKVRETKTQPK